MVPSDDAVITAVELLNLANMDRLTYTLVEKIDEYLSQLIIWVTVEFLMQVFQL